MTEIILLNFLIYLFTTIHFYKKEGLTIFSGLWIYYTIFAAMSLFVIVTGIYEERFFSFGLNYKSVTIVPYIYMYVTVFLLLLPFKYIKGCEYFLNINLNNKVINNIVNLCMFFLLFYTAIKLIIFFKFNDYSLLERREMSVTGVGFISRDKNPYFWLLDYMVGIIHAVLFPFIVLYVCKYYTLHKITTKRALYCVSLCVIGPCASYFMTSNRSGIFFLFTNILFFFLLFYYEFSKQTKRTIYKAIIALLIPLILYSFLISQERYEGSDISMEYGILSYFGESFPNLGTMVYDNVSMHTFGMIYFSDYVGLVFDNIPKIEDGLTGFYEYWTMITGVRMLVFKTLFGDLYIEFGEVGAILFMLILSWGMCSFAKKTKIPSFMYYSIMYIYFSFATNAILDFGVSFGKLYTLRVVIGIIIFNFVIRKLIVTNKEIL